MARGIRGYDSLSTLLLTSDDTVLCARPHKATSRSSTARREAFRRPHIKKMMVVHHRPLVHVAPMQCYTNRHLRQLHRLLSSEAILWTEMEKVSHVLANPARRLAHADNEHPLVLQLGSDQPKELAAAPHASARSDRQPADITWRTAQVSHHTLRPKSAPQAIYQSHAAHI